VSEPGLLIVGHGTIDADGVAEFLDFADRVRERVPRLDVGAGFIELARPAVSAAVDDLVAGGAGDLIAVPLTLLAAGHTKDDIPATLARERLRHPGVRFRYGRDLGVRPELLEVVEARVTAALAGEDPAGWAIVLVGRGSTDPDANADLAKIARLYFEGRAHPFVEHGFVSLAPPSVAAVLERCRRLGAERVVVVPYFLFTGVLERRIGEQARAYGAEHGVEVRVAGYLGPDPAVVDLVLERYREAIEGDARMNCDVCVHRVALPGYEHKVGAPATPHFHPDVDGHEHHHHHHHHH